MKREPFGEYYGVRKVNWDQLWHALFRTEDGEESWDRVTREQALNLVDQLEKGR